MAKGEKSSSSSSTSGMMLRRCNDELSLGELKTSGILTGALTGVPRGEWNGLDLSVNNGPAIARFELVLTIP